MAAKKEKPKKKISSAEKRAKQAEKRRLRNKAVKTHIKTTTKKVLKAVEQGDAEAARDALTVAVPVLQKAASKGVIHKRTASRKVSRLSLKVNALSVNVPESEAV